jgi:DNA-binding LacI/PurR family transcriptional regulator
MARVRIFSAVEQVAAFLREELSRGQWGDLLPGVDRLAPELGVSRKTLEAALSLLEDEGVLVRQGPRRKRSIVRGSIAPNSKLRVALLAGEVNDFRLEYIVELQHRLAEAGHHVFFPPKTLIELGMEPARIARLVERTDADAWVVLAGSYEVLEWFSRQPAPSFALFGRRRGLSIAGVGPDKGPAYVAAVRRLVGLGHRRIVLLARPRRRLPEPGASEQAFLNELAAHGLAVSAFNLPSWEETIDGFQARLDSLFQLTPPTALIIDEGPLFAAAQQFLACRKILVPQDVSLICTDADPSFDWCQPSISHIRWDSRPVVHRIVRWVDHVSRGRRDLRQTLTFAEFVGGGTVGPRKDK